MTKSTLIHCQTCEARNISAFRQLRGANLEEQDTQKTCGIYYKKELLFEEDGMSNGVYCISSGKIKLFTFATDGRVQILRFAKKGDVIGYRSLISNEPYSSSAEAIETSTACFIPKSTIMKALQEDPALSLNFMQLLSKNLNEAREQVVNANHKHLPERIAEALLLLKESYGLKQDGETLDISITRLDLASYVGTAPESIIRTLYDFKKKGLVELKGKNIMLKNIKGLLDCSQVNF